MTGPYVHLKTVLGLPSIADARPQLSDDNLLETGVHASYVSTEDSLVLRDASGNLVVELVRWGHRENDDQVEIPGEALPWQAHAEITSLLLDEARRLVDRSGNILQILAKADHYGHTTTQTVEALASLVERPVAFKGPSHLLLTWAGSTREMDPVRRATVETGEINEAVRAHLEKQGVLSRIGTADHAFRVDGDDRIGMSPRVVCPVRGAEVLFGYLSIAEGSRPLDPLDYLAVETGAVVLSFQMARERALAEQSRTDQAIIAYDLVFGPVSGQPGIRRMHAERAGIDLDLEHRVIALIPDAQSTVNAERWARERESMLATLGDLMARKQPRSVAVFGVEDALVILIALDADATHEMADHAVAALRAYHQVHHLYVGISGAHRGAHRWRVGWDEARLAAWTAMGKGSDSSSTHYEGLGALRLLNSLSDDVINEQIDLTLGTDARFLDAFWETYSALVATGYNKAEAARRLFVHVNTLRYRIDRIKAVTGCDPDDPGDRFTLECVLRLIDLRAARQAAGY